MASAGFIAVLGAGESGTGAAVLAKKKGFEVLLSDKGSIKDKYKKVLLHHDIRFEEGNHSVDEILKASEVIKSPGIPDAVPLIQRIKKAGIPLISEIEFAGRYTDAKKICITGSNGKTTTTLLTHHILTKAGINAGLAGNVGRSFALQVAEEQHDVYVLEISSFQLDGMFDFKADIAILLNITPDHLDRYDYDFQKYAASKFRITNNQNIQDAFIFCLDDRVIREGIARRNISARMYPFSIKEIIEGEGAYTDGSNLIINTKTTQVKMTLEELALQGKHNLYNSMAAGIAAKILDIRKDRIKNSLSDFQNVEHRLEFVSSIHGISFINDSKATNVNSTWYALESVSEPVVWIAGGIDKGNDYSLLKEMVHKKVKAIICLGVDNHRIHSAFADLVSLILDTRSAEDAVRKAFAIAEDGDTVLLSPACASFDLFDNYEDRGRQFKNAVREL